MPVIIAWICDPAERHPQFVDPDGVLRAGDAEGLPVWRSFRLSRSGIWWNWGYASFPLPFLG